METGTTNKSFWQTKDSRDFYQLDNAEREILHPFVAKIINNLNPATLLDYGCGNGYLSTLINTKTEVHLYDSNEDYINQLVIDKDKKNISPLSYVQQIKDNYYDCVVQSAVLMCVPTKDKLNDIFLLNNRSLKSDGTLVVIITHPCFLQYKFGHYFTSFNHSNFKYLEEGLKYEVYMKNDDQNPVVFTDYNWSLSTIVNLIIKNNFRIKEIIEHPDMQYKHNQPNKFAVPWMFIKATKK